MDFLTPFMPIQLQRLHRINVRVLEHFVEDVLLPRISYLNCRGILEEAQPATVEILTAEVLDVVDSSQKRGNLGEINIVTVLYIDS